MYYIRRNKRKLEGPKEKMNSITFLPVNTSFIKYLISYYKPFIVLFLAWQQHFFLLSCRFYWLASPKFLNYFRTRNFHVALLNKFNIKMLLSINAITDHAEQKEFNLFNLSAQLFLSLKIWEIEAPISATTQYKQ